MKTRITVVIAAVLIGLGLWQLQRAPGTADASPEATAPSLRRGTPATGASSGGGSPAAPAPEVSELARGLNDPAGDIRADLRVVQEILDAFRSNFPRDGNPVGTNAEITAVLTGRNRLRLALLPPRHPAINAAGELCDRWGTPFFFHAESAQRMEVRSAGPDRKLWNDDDVVLAP